MWERLVKEKLRKPFTLIKPRPKRTPRNLSVLRCESITPNMRRLTLGGDGLRGFPEDQESGYIKFLLPCEGEEPYLRTYTIRKQRSDSNEIDVDFALHEGSAPASTWAANARPGDTIDITGPGAKKLVDLEADWFFLAGDMTALPAISVNLELLPENARGYAVIEILSEEDAQDIVAPEGIEIHWVVNAKPGTEDTPLVDKVRDLAWLEGRPSVWAACEFSSMKLLRKYFKQEREVSKHDVYVSSYWKMGVSEDQHKRIKRKDSEENPD